MKQLGDICLSPDATIHQVISAMDSGAMRVALVNDSAGRLVGIITDGDVRRGLLQGLGLTHTADNVMRTDFKSLPDGSTREQALELMHRFKIQHVPCINDSGVLTNVFVRDQLDISGQRNNWVVLMAGGEGKRLRPHTASIPKPMIKVGNKPLLLHILEGCIEAGFTKVFISVNYLRDEIMRYFGDGNSLGIEIIYLLEDEPLGTAGSLALLPEPPQLPVLIMNADVLNRLDYNNLFEVHERSGAAGTLCIRNHEFEVPFGVVDVKDSNVLGLKEKPSISLNVSTGIYVLEPSLIAKVRRGQPLDMPELVAKGLEEGYKLSAFPLHEYWLDVGHPQALEQAQGDWR